MPRDFTRFVEILPRSISVSRSSEIFWQDLTPAIANLILKTRASLNWPDLLSSKERNAGHGDPFYSGTSDSYGVFFLVIGTPTESGRFSSRLKKGGEAGFEAGESPVSLQTKVQAIEEKG